MNGEKGIRSMNKGKVDGMETGGVGEMGETVKERYRKDSGSSAGSSMGSLESYWGKERGRRRWREGEGLRGVGKRRGRRKRGQRGG